MDDIPADMNFKITVHDFVAVGDSSFTRTARQLEKGRDLAVACSSGDRWVTPQVTINASMFTLRRERLYQYRTSPPTLTTGAKSVSIDVPEWDQQSRVEDPDYSRLYDLQEFESTDFQTSLMRSTIGTGDPSRYKKRVQEGDLNASELAKRPRLEVCSLLELIPQPHFVPAPAARFRPVDTSKIPSYQKRSPSPIAPYDTAAVDQLLNGRYRRAAWVIPVRGSLPWDGASTAVILEGAQAASRSPSPCLQIDTAQPRAITWTPDSLQHLWTFLGSIQQAKHLGPLSLSFHAAPMDAISTRDSISEPVWESNRPFYHQGSSWHTAVSPNDFETPVCSAHLESVDHIKVFHDMPYSLSLRNILDAYRYEPVNGKVLGRSGANDRKIRLLKGVRLVLLDERSKAAFLM